MMSETGVLNGKPVFHCVFNNKTFDDAIFATGFILGRGKIEREKRTTFRRAETSSFFRMDNTIKFDSKCEF